MSQIYLRQEKVLIATLAVVGGVLVLLGMIPLIQLGKTLKTRPIAPVQMVEFALSSEYTHPYILTDSGQLLEPLDNGEWRVVDVGQTTHIQDFVIDQQAQIWIAADEGLFAQQAHVWEVVNPAPTRGLIQTADDLVVVDHQGQPHSIQHATPLNIPLGGTPIAEWVTLPSNRQVIRAGDKLYHAVDSLASWQPLDTGEPIAHIWLTEQGTLWAGTHNEILEWDEPSQTWQAALPNAINQPFDTLAQFQEQTYALVNGKLFRFTDSAWAEVEIGTGDRYLTHLISDGETALWVMDRNQMKLFTSPDGINWEGVSIAIQPETPSPSLTNN
ncbi:MAG: hypothetical protein ACOYLB_08930 [Phototrophicaceae bacterium]